MCFCYTLTVDLCLYKQLRLVHLKHFCYLMAPIYLLIWCFVPVGKNALHLAARNAQSLCVQKLLQVKLFSQSTQLKVEHRNSMYLCAVFFLSQTISTLLYPLFDVEEKYWIIFCKWGFLRTVIWTSESSLHCRALPIQTYINVSRFFFSLYCQYFTLQFL